MIEVQQLSKWYGPVLALDHIDLQVPKGQILGFLGPNGAGKSTTLRILTCFMPATSGTAKINGFDVFTQSDQVRRHIGYLPESTPMYPEMRVEEQLMFFGKLHGMSRSQVMKRIDELSDRCGLVNIRRRLIGQLSKGNKQRVGIAQALLHDPEVLVLDEPTVGLDPTQIAEVRKLINELAGEKTIILSTHILPEVEKTCERVVIIANGRISAEGSPNELKEQVKRNARVVLDVKANPTTVQEKLKGLSQVGDVEISVDGEWSHALVTSTNKEEDLRPVLAKAAVDNGWSIRELHHEAASLEEFFVQITAGDAVKAA